MICIWELDTVYHENFEAEKFRGKLYMQSFARKLSRNPRHFLLNPYLNSSILNFHIKKFHENSKNHENRKTFLP